MKNIIISIIFGVAIAALLYFASFSRPEKSENPDVIKTSEVASNEETGGEKIVSNTSSDNTVDENAFKAFGKVKSTKSVVELGSQGFNYFIIEIDQFNNYNVVKKEFGVSLASNGLLSEEILFEKLSTAIAEISNFGVKSSNIHFIVSSGALKNETATMAVKVLKKKTKFVVNTVTPEQEGIYAYKALAANIKQRNFLVFDLGSSNGKLAFFDKERNALVSIETPGAKYYDSDMSDEEAKLKVNSALDQVIGNFKDCYVIGGIPFQIAASQGCQSRYCKISPEEFTTAGKKEFCGKLILQQFKNYNLIMDTDANFSIGFLLSLK